MSRHALVLAVILSGSVPSASPAEPPVARLVGALFERLSPEAPVSGNDILGIVALGERRPRGAQPLFVRSPSGRAEAVCVEMITRTAHYEASGTFDLPQTTPGGYVRLSLSESRHPEILRAAVLEDFAVLARLGRCDQRKGALVPVAWGAPPPAGAEIKLAVTVQAANDQPFVWVTAGGPAKRSTCTRIQARRHTAFDAYCELRLPADVASPIRLQLERCAFDECTRAPAVQVFP